MSIKTSSILVDGTVSTTGGTATGMIDKGNNSSNWWTGFLDDSSEFINNTLINFGVRDPKPESGAPNGYTQARSEVKIHVPLLLDNGEMTKNTLKIILAVDHETTDAEVESILVMGSQLLADSDFSDFWKRQALS